MTALNFTHLTLNRPVTVTKELVVAVWSAESLNGTYIIGNGGAIVPVKEPVDIVRQKVWGNNEVAPVTTARRARRSK